MKRVMVFVIVAALGACAAQATTIIFEVEGELDWSGGAHFARWSAEGTWGGTITFDLQYYFWPGEDPTVEDISVYVLSYVSSDLEIYSGVTHEWSIEPMYPCDNWGTIGGEEIEFDLNNPVYWYVDSGIGWEWLEHEIEFAFTFDMPGPSWDTVTLESDSNSTMCMSSPDDLNAGTGTWTGTLVDSTYGGMGTFTANQIPEPATIVLAGAALAGLAGLARRRR